jgi:hypothetical protein
MEVRSQLHARLLYPRYRTPASRRSGRRDDLGNSKKFLPLPGFEPQTVKHVDYSLYWLRYTNFYEKQPSHFTCLGQTLTVAIYSNIYPHFCTHLTPIQARYVVRFKFRVLKTEIWWPRQFVSSTYPSKSATTEHNRNCASSVALLEGRRRIFCYKHILQLLYVLMQEIT